MLKYPLLCLFLAGVAVAQPPVNVAGIPTYLIVGSVAVTANRPVLFEAGSGGHIIPMTGTGLAMGIAEDSGTTGQIVRVIQLGMVTAEFDVTPVLDQIATFSGGLLHNSGQTSFLSVANTVGVAGRAILARTDVCTNCATVNFLGPAVMGGLVGYSTLSGAPTLATVATSGLYADLLSKPTFATVATTGAYADLSGKPTIPAAQIQSDWNQSNTGLLDFIKNKPTLGTAAAQNTSAFDAAGAASAVQALALLKANNLSDLASAATARTNLGISTVGNTGAYADLTGKPTIPTVPKIFSGSATTNASGVASFTVTSAGFTAAPTSCSFTATSGTATAANSYNTTGSVATAWTSSSVAAFVTQPISILIGGLGVSLVGSGITVQATCFGS